MSNLGRMVFFGASMAFSGTCGVGFGYLAAYSADFQTALTLIGIGIGAVILVSTGLVSLARIEGETDATRRQIRGLR